MPGALPLARAAVERTLLPLRQATQLPPAAFTDPAVLAWELETLFTQGWIGAGHVEGLTTPGAYRTLEVGGEGILLVGDADGLPRAFRNRCRHRGARLLEAPEGTATRLRCPYHAWTYALDGSLRSAPFTDGIEGFDPAGNALEPVRLAVVEGLVMLDLSGSAASPAEHVGDLAGILSRYGVGRLSRAERVVYEVGANWKAIGENYSECLHCPGVHPELNRLSHYRSGVGIDGDGAWCGGSMALAEHAATMGRGAATAVRPALAGLEGDALRTVLYFLLFPNVLVSLHPDYVMLHTLWPRAVDHTTVVCEWFFDPDALAAPGFDASDAVGFWDQVNREDWAVCELTQRGLRGTSATPGRYTTAEGDVHAFDAMVAARYVAALAA